MTLKNMDGVWLNLSHISACYPYEQFNQTTGTCKYKIRFKCEPEGYLGKTEYNSEGLCQEAIEKLLEGGDW